MFMRCSKYLQLRVVIHEQSNPDQRVLYKIILPEGFHTGRYFILGTGKPVSES